MRDKPAIGILDLGYDSYDYETTYFRKNGYTLKFYDGQATDIENKILFCRDIDGLLIRMTPIDAYFLSKTKHLKAIVRYGIGYDNIDIDAATKHGIPVANVQGYASESVSDHALALLFSCLRGIRLASENIQSHITKPPFTDMFELKNKTLGIIGLGRIGSRFSQKSYNLFNKILAYDPYIADKKFIMAGAQKASLGKIYKKSHVISLHCNLTSETTKMIDAKAFLKMDQKPIIINTARGSLIDEKSLKEALDAHQIHSAGIDVFENEPLTAKQDFLLNHPRVNTTGHYAWYSDKAVKNLQKRAAQNIIKMLQGKKIKDQLNKITVKYSPIKSEKISH